VGLEVVRSDGTRLSAKRAAVRVLVMPISFFLWLGLIPIVTSRRHRALHDKAADTVVVYDWPATSPRYLSGRRGLDAVPIGAPPDDADVVTGGGVPR
jgi:uncharacterized RDD family membrane protein YckC